MGSGGCAPLDTGGTQKLLLALAASLAALFANPFGYKLVLYPFDLLFHQQGVMHFIEEWDSVDFNSLNGRLALGMIFGLLAAVVFSRRRWKLDEVLLTAFSLWAALSHVRFYFSPVSLSCRYFPHAWTVSPL